MRTPFRCERCGSAGSIEFGMCQVCLAEYPDEEPLFGEIYGELSPAREISREGKEVLARAS